LTPAELSKRYQYDHDRALEELVDIAMAWGYEAVNGDGQARQVLELHHSGAGSITFPTGLLFFLEKNQRSFFEKIF
jgi:hypothetical protein